jgi:hypothetical protein
VAGPANHQPRLQLSKAKTLLLEVLVNITAHNSAQPAQQQKHWQVSSKQLPTMTACSSCFAVNSTAVILPLLPGMQQPMG